MSLSHFAEFQISAIRQLAQQICVAAKTAPKGKGADNLTITVAEKETINLLSNKLIEMSNVYQVESFHRDALNILEAPIMILMGTKITPIGLKKCGLCGFPNCAEKQKFPEIPCAYNTGDLGIALGSAVSMAANLKVDNRIMYTVGLAAKELQLLGPDVKIIYAIPLSATAKNPFFDRRNN